MGLGGPGIAVKPEGTVFKRYYTDEQAGCTKWEVLERHYDVPYYRIDRADFHKLLTILLPRTLPSRWVRPSFDVIWA